MLLTLSITTSKCLLEYHQVTNDIKPFLSKTFLEKFSLWTEKIGSDTAKALVGIVAKEVKSVLENRTA